MKKFKQILDLIRKTGDRFIFEDDQGNSFVVLSTEEYESLLIEKSKVKDLSQEELLNKINQDIAFWQASKEKESLPETWDELEEKIQAADSDIIETQYYFEPTEEDD